MAILQALVLSLALYRFGYVSRGTTLVVFISLWVGGVFFAEWHGWILWPWSTTQRLVWLHSNYNVDVTMRLVLPEAVRMTTGGAGKAGGAFARWYFLPNAQWDGAMLGRYQGVPFKHPTPDPVWQNMWPVGGEKFLYVHPPEKQLPGWQNRSRRPNNPWIALSPLKMPFPMKCIRSTAC